MIHKRLTPQFLDKIFFFFASLIIGAKVGLLFVANLYSPPFTSDSWAYFNISQNIFTDFYKVSYIRQFEFVSDYSTSFPPLYPLMIAIVNRVFNLGIYAGYFLNFLIVGLLFVVITVISKKITRYFTPAVYVFMVLLFTVDFVREVVSARSIPLTLLLTSVMMLVFLQKRLSVSQVVLLGGVAGLLTLNRFDFLIPGLILGVVCVTRTSEKKVTNSAAYFGSYLLFISPWILYSLVHFNNLFISDNQRTLLLATKTFPLDYYPDQKVLPTLWSNPAYWFVYRVFFKGILSLIEFAKSIWNSVLLQRLVLLNIFFVFLQGLTEKRLKSFSSSRERSTLLLRYLWLLPVFFGQLFLVALTGFLDMRYSVSMIYYLTFLLLLCAFVFLEKFFSRKYIVTLMIIFVSLPLCLYVIFPVREEILEAAKQKQEINQEYLRASDQILEIAKTMHERVPEPVALIHPTDSTPALAAELAVLTGVKVLETPSNLNKYLLVSLINNYQVTHIYTTCPTWINLLQENFIVEKTSVPYFFYLTRKNDGIDTVMIPYSIEVDQAFLTCDLGK